MSIAITGVIRLQYNPFGDPLVVPLFIFTVIAGQVMEKFYYRLSDVKIKRLNWVSALASSSCYFLLHYIASHV
jgi:hypothetical protein